MQTGNAYMIQTIIMLHHQKAFEDILCVIIDSVHLRVIIIIIVT